MREHELKQIPTTALFIAAAVLLPQLFHIFGLGPTFLPMFLPVLTGAMFLSWKFALVLGIVSPLVSWVFTGMPPLVPPLLPLVTAELASSALLVSWLHVHRKKNVWIALLVSIIWDRSLLFALTYLILPVFGLQHPLFSATFVLSGTPGIILQIVIIPQLVPVLHKRFPENRL